ncbi:nicotinamide-nucleotide adenylyltransferase [Candidatus Woesearchaeota archaeon]|nr:nicotinamide-nucleotide adenylyltransferase [Candidatus Woesearchaeota archaeon]
MKALFIGRFQPFHLGHLHIVKQIIKEQGSIVIAIGSSQESDTLENPFTAEERKEMIEHVLDAESIDNKDYIICLVPDLGKHDKWVEHVISITGNISVIYTGSILTKRLFREKGFKIINLNRIKDISATMIRERLVKNQMIDKFIHPKIADFLKRINAGERLKDITRKETQ